MTAMRWELAWRFSIVLAFLLVRHTTALSVSTEKPSTSYKSSDDKYDFVDVAQQQGEIFQSDTGQTSRYFTLGEVDESFWLEHLGDDFKNAIHLQVGGEEQCNGVFNMSENGSAYKVQQEEPTNDLVRENEVSLSTTNDIKAEEKSKSKTKGESKKSRKMRRKSRPEPKTQITEKVVATPKNATKIGETRGQVESTSEAYTINEDQSYTEASNKAPYKEELKKYGKFQHINLKYEPKANKTDTKNSTLVENMATTNEPIEETPIVVNLPESKKLIELETSDTAVVVKIPPVIYHSEPTAFADPLDYTDNTYSQTEKHSQTETLSQTQTNTHKQTETHTHSQTQATLPRSAEEPAHTDDGITNVQYTQLSYPQMTYEQQQHYLQEHLQQTQHKLQSQQHLQHTNLYQPHQQSQYPVQMQQTQYQETSLYDQPEQHEYQQYSKPYISSNYYNGGSSSYHINGICPTTPTTASIHKPNEIESNGNGKYYYMISKRSVEREKSPAAHEEASTPKTPPKQATSSENSRVTRATEDLYQEGL